MKIFDFLKHKQQRKPITMVTAYDFSSARILSKSDIDCLLVGDSVAMVVHGFSTTLSATVDMMTIHIEAVRRGAPEMFVVGDMPFLSVRKGLEPAMCAVEALMRAGANCVKIEGCRGHEEVISHIIESGVPVMGHLGLTPQSFESLGAFKVQGRGDEANRILSEARELESRGCFALVLECVPNSLAATIQQELKIPVIGIGAGKNCDGQVLVYHDLLGLNLDFKPKFLRRYFEAESHFVEALKSFVTDVQDGSFPSEAESYHS